YLVFAADTHMKEIELGKLAQQKSTNADVRQYAEMLITDHTKALEDLKKTAEAKNISLPTALSEDGKDAYNKLSEEKAEDFDKKNEEMAVDCHEMEIENVENDSDEANDEYISM